MPHQCVKLTWADVWTQIYYGSGQEYCSAVIVCRWIEINELNWMNRKSSQYWTPIGWQQQFLLSCKVQISRQSTSYTYTHRNASFFYLNLDTTGALFLCFMVLGWLCILGLSVVICWKWQNLYVHRLNLVLIQDRPGLPCHLFGHFIHWMTHKICYKKIVDAN